jgi:hypothetical protein
MREKRGWDQTEFGGPKKREKGFKEGTTDGGAGAGSIPPPTSICNNGGGWVGPPALQDGSRYKVRGVNRHNDAATTPQQRQQQSRLAARKLHTRRGHIA